MEVNVRNLLVNCRLNRYSLYMQLSFMRVAAMSFLYVFTFPF